MLKGPFTTGQPKAMRFIALSRTVRSEYGYFTSHNHCLGKYAVTSVKALCIEVCFISYHSGYDIVFCH